MVTTPVFMASRDGLAGIPEQARGQAWEFAGKRENGIEIFAVWPPAGYVWECTGEVFPLVQEAASASGYKVKVVGGSSVRTSFGRNYEVKSVALERIAG